LTWTNTPGRKFRLGAALDLPRSNIKSKTVNIRPKQILWVVGWNIGLWVTFHVWESRDDWTHVSSVSLCTGYWQTLSVLTNCPSVSSLWRKTYSILPVSWIYNSQIL